MRVAARRYVLRAPRHKKKEQMADTSRATAKASSGYAEPGRHPRPVPTYTRAQLTLGSSKKTQTRGSLSIRSYPMRSTHRRSVSTWK
jgi:hypothetical protein